MLFVETGSILIGFTKETVCLQCNNKKPLQIRQEYVKQSILLIPIPTSYRGIYSQCSVCEKKYWIVNKYFQLFFIKKSWDNFYYVLEEGKEYTQYWISQLSQKDKEQALKRLKALKANNIIK